jgi:hypothetical protein
VVLEPLTPEERARHERGIEKIRRRLFRRYQPTDYFIVPNSERVIGASAESCWNAACGSFRVFRFGGLSYAVDCEDVHGLGTFTVAHVHSDRFAFWITAAKGHTVSSLSVRFSELDETVYEYLCSFRRSNSAPPYSGNTPTG